MKLDQLYIKKDENKRRWWQKGTPQVLAAIMRANTSLCHLCVSPTGRNFYFSFHEVETHQISGTLAGNPRSSLWFSDSRYRSSTQFFSWCIQNTRYFSRCSSLGCPALCSQRQPLEPSARTKNIQKVGRRGALSSIHALPWPKLSVSHCNDDDFTLDAL